MMARFGNYLARIYHRALGTLVLVIMKLKEQLWKIVAMNYFQVWRKEKRQPENDFLIFINNVPSIENQFYEIKVTFFFLCENILTQLNNVRSEKERSKIKFRLFKHRNLK